ncbi:hypothetical protein RIF29_05041 [Crotalaria pallida]|uniref:Uncharacterized protein n=1 Tax=Crotalaria pallida TaxID=3830 RepID=A0AAN9J1W5_CROPI
MRVLVCNLFFSNVVTEEKSEESTLTTAQNDAILGDSAESSSQLTDSSSNSLDYITGLIDRGLCWTWSIKRPNNKSTISSTMCM